MKLKNKTIVLTHATNTLGRALAKALDQAGAILLLSAGDESALKTLAGELQADRHMIIPGDINVNIGRVGLISACRDKDTSIDVVIHNPQCGGQGSFRGISQGDISQFINDSLTAPILLIRALLPQLLKRDSALVVNIGTLSASIGLPGFALDGAARFGLRGFSEALGRELQNTSVKTVYVAHRGIAQSSPRDKQEASQDDTLKTSSTSLNKALKRPLDKPAVVAKTILSAMAKEAPFSQLGWLERYWIKKNACRSQQVDKTILKHLSAFAHFAKQKTFQDR